MNAGCVTVREQVDSDVIIVVRDHLIIVVCDVVNTHFLLC